MNDETPQFYLFVSFTRTSEESSRTVFYKVEGEPTAQSLCRLFTKECSEDKFHLREAEFFSTEEQVLLDERLDLLACYDDPDSGIYDPEPSPEIHLRAQYAVQAGVWEAQLRKRTPQQDRQSAHDDGESSSQRGSPTIDELSELPPEERRNSLLILLVLLAQAYYKLLECTISMSGYLWYLDLELNQSYLWTIEVITKLVKNSEDLNDFPISFEPLFDDLYPSTIRELEWEEVAPDAERFLSTVQRYAQSKRIYEPEKGSPGWCFVEFYRPSVNTAIQRAETYHKRVRQLYDRALATSARGPLVAPKLTNGSSFFRPRAFRFL